MFGGSEGRRGVSVSVDGWEYMEFVGFGRDRRARAKNEWDGD